MYDPLLVKAPYDPLLETPADGRLDLKVGDKVRVGTRRGTVARLTQDPMYPVKIQFDGESRLVQPMYDLIERERAEVL